MTSVPTGSALTRRRGAPSSSGESSVASDGAAVLPDEGATVSDEGAGVLASLQDVAHALRTLAVRASGAQAWTGATRASAIRVLDGLAGLVTAVRGPVLVAQHAAAAAAGAERSFVDTRARLTGTTRFTAARQVDSARAMQALPDVGQAVLDQAMPTGHLDVLGRTLAEAGPQVTAILTRPETQRRLVDLARHSDPREFSRSVAALVAAHDPDALADTREAARRARYLTMTHTPEGTFLKGRLDPLSGQALARALDATGHRADPDRTADQARADALTALAHHTLTAGHRPEPGCGTSSGASADEQASPADRARNAAQPDGAVSAPAAQVNLLVPAETWLEIREHRRARRAVTDAPTLDASPTGGARRLVLPAVSDDGIVLTRTELATALCDCTMTRVVMDAQGLPLDVGRARRMFTPAQRTAVIARDRQCAWNGCSTTARHSQVHHIRWWHRDAGRSDLANAVLLCGFHHHEVHRLDLDIHRLHAPDAPPEHEDPGRAGSVALAGLAGPPRYEFRDRRGLVVNGPDP